MPKRIQRQRVRGWKKPKGTVCVTRGTAWGNPFIVRPDLEPGAMIGPRYIAVPTAEDAVECFRIRLAEMPEEFPPLANLRGKDLACWCPLPKAGEPDCCHGAILL